jgi:hypothetical protein
MRIIPNTDITSSDLIIDAIYESSPAKNIGADVLNPLLPGVGNQGGFRAAGKGQDKTLVVLYSSGENKDWPDTLNLNTGEFIYFGDNKKPGHELHDTPKKGNQLLRRAFDLLHSTPEERAQIPPFFVFKKHPTQNGPRSVQFKGLAVPGYPGMSATQDLVAVWKTTDGQRFQNYRSVFTVLNAASISRAWINDVLAGNPHTNNAPKAWTDWIETGHYSPLTSEPTTQIRSESEQLPDTPLKASILKTVWDHFDDNDRNTKHRSAFVFEHFAARIFQMHDHRVIVDDITRNAVDGGRDAVGRYLLGLNDDPVYAEFSLEAKCYRPGINDMSATRVGVKEVSRLISRIRHRQFGVLVTTSAVHKQAYEEVREDKHPIIFISGKDIAEILIASGYNTPEAVKQFLDNEFPTI